MTELPSRMTPFLPTGDGDLEDLARELLSCSAALSGILHPKTQVGVIELIRLINSYYSNLIEGRSTHPVEIERAMRQDYAGNAAKRSLQLESLAHIHCQREIEKRLEEDPDMDTSDPAFLAWMHAVFYEQLPEELCWVENPDTKDRIRVIGGQFRERDVQVGLHLPPASEYLPLFIDRFHEIYQKGKLHGVKPIIAIAAAHHRLAWIHPFLDGNGRVARLFTDASFRTLPMPGYGLWNVSRGLARKKDQYMEALESADSPRRGALDGRGNLSTSGLTNFCHFFLTTCQDQVDYMSKMLRLDGLLGRITGYVNLRAHNMIEMPEGYSTGLKPDAAKMLQEVLLRGEMPRGEVAALCKSPRMGKDILAQLAAEKILKSDSPKGPVSLAFPTHIAGYLFPDLYPMGSPTSSQ